jgi:NNP family nitrate/nitrite transporter-like MFS transporter
MNIIILMLFWLLWYLAFSTRILAAPFLPLVEETFSINHATAGGLTLFTGLGATTALVFTGFLSLRIGYKKVIAGGMLTAATALLGLFAADSYIVFAAMLFLVGLGGGVYLPCAVPILTSVFDREYWGRAIGVHETAAGLSLLMIPFLAAATMAYIPWRCFFLILCVIFLVATGLLWCLSPDIRVKPSISSKPATILRRYEFWCIASLWISCGMASLGIYNIVPLFLVNEKAFAVETANHLFGISRIGGFAGQICIGFFLDRLDTKKIIITLTALSGISGFALAFSQSTTLLVIMLFLQATFCVAFFPAGVMAISKLTVLEERSSFTGILMGTSLLIGIGITPLILGSIADVWNFQIGILVLALVNLIACIPGMLLPRM